jgi:hypothetical protein
MMAKNIKNKRATEVFECNKTPESGAIYFVNKEKRKTNLQS